MIQLLIIVNNYTKAEVKALHPNNHGIHPKMVRV